MAIGVVKLSKSQRKTLTYIFCALNIIQVLSGLTITGTSIYVYIAIAPILPSEKPEINFVFVVIGMYGTHVILHWLVGLKICQKCYLQSHKKSTKRLLLLWTCAGTNTVINLIIIASVSKKINKHLIRSMKNSLQHGINNYLIDENWKYAMDKIQFNQRCCGIKSFEDWHDISWLTKYHVDVKSEQVEQLRSSSENLHLPVTPWSCCKLDFPMQCLHDPLQQVQYAHIWVDEPKIVSDSINTNGCLDNLKKPITSVINSFVTIACSVVVMHIIIFIISRILYTSCRNAILLNDPDGVAPGWIFGRGDCGYSSGPTLSEIMGTEIILEAPRTPKRRFRERFQRRKKSRHETTEADTSGEEFADMEEELKKLLPQGAE